MKKSSKYIKSAIAGLAIFGATAANAGLIANSTFDVAVGQVNVSFGELDWLGLGGVGAAFNNPGFNASVTNGQFQVISGTGSFAADAGTNGTIRDMSQNPVDANHVPLGASSTAGFLSLASHPTYKFTLNYLTPGNIASIPSPYILTQLGSSVSALIDMRGRVFEDLNSNGVKDLGEAEALWTGSLTSIFNNTSIASLVGRIQSGQTIKSSWTGQFSVPEPTSVALLGVAFLGLGMSRRRKA